MQLLKLLLIKYGSEVNVGSLLCLLNRVQHKCSRWPRSKGRGGSEGRVREARGICVSVKLSTREKGERGSKQVGRRAYALITIVEVTIITIITTTTTPSPRHHHVLLGVLWTNVWLHQRQGQGQG